MGIRQRRARKHAKTHAVGFSIGGFFGFIALLAIAFMLSLGGLVDIWLKDLPDYTNPDAFLAAEPTQILDANGEVVADLQLQNRKSVDLNQISPYVLKATVDTEDARFYSHNGIDPQGILRAMVVSAKGGREGASTITQQLVRNTILSDEQFEKTIKRKVREAYLATQMERIFTKDQILNLYLNTIYYGNGAYGIEAASNTYFGKHASELTLSEAAMLSGLPQAPSAYNPSQHMEAAKARRDVVLSRMETVGDITEAQKEAAEKEEIVLNPETVQESGYRYPFFTSYVKDVLEKDFDSNVILKGGLKIYTTLDPKYQQAAQDSVEEFLETTGDPDLQQAVVIMDPKDGHVKAIVGGRSWSKSQFNLATQSKRQPGSSFKGFVLAAAISSGMNPTTLINCNSPLQVGPYRVGNYGNISYGVISMAQATAVSSNTGYVQIARAIGLDKFAETCQACGIDEQIPQWDSSALGAKEVSVLEMCEGYNTFNAGGVHRDPVVITKIEDRHGNIVYQHKDKTTEALTPQVASAVTEVLRGVVTGGTGAPLNNYFSGQPVAGKTGTTEFYGDLWFCGYTPQMTMAVWTGHANNTPVYIGGAPGHPYNTSIPTFGLICNKLLANVPYEQFTNAGTPTYKENSYWQFLRPVNQGAASQQAPTDNANAQSEETTQKDATEAEGKKAETQTEQPAETTPAQKPQQPAEKPSQPEQSGGGGDGSKQ